MREREEVHPAKLNLREGYKLDTLTKNNGNQVYW
jgi:hypothetical protein